MKTVNEQINKRIKALRKYLRMTQVEFALKIDRAPGFLAHMEINISGVSDATISNIVSVFGVSEEWLRHGTVDGVEICCGESSGDGSSCDDECDKGKCSCSSSSSDFIDDRIFGHNGCCYQRRMAMEQENIGERIKEVRTNLKLPQVEFARQLHCSQGHVASVEEKRYTPSSDWVKNVAETFDVSYVWLMGGDKAVDKVVAEVTEAAEAEEQSNVGG